jgi:C-terminal processing protease CtpA/Prc
MGGWMKPYRFVVIILLLLAGALMACQSEEVVETAIPVPPTPTPTVTPQALQQLGVSEVVVEPEEELKSGQEIVLVDISSLITENADELSGYSISAKMPSIFGVDSVVIQLPLQPHGNTVDVNENGADDLGVQLYALKIQDALVETAPLSGAYTELSTPPLAGLSLQFDPENYANIESGWMLAWSADNQQMFPSGSGEDGVLFTDDDPLQPLELGYTAMLYEDGKIARFREASTRAVFSTNLVPLTFDLSGMAASVAYDEALSVLQKYYPAWDDEKSSVMKDIKSGYSDEELQFSAMAAAVEDDLVNYEPQEGGYLWLKSLYPADYGIEININEENEIRASDIRFNGPAEDAGLEYGDEILLVNGQSVLDAIDAVQIPFVSARNGILQQKLKGFFLFRGQEGQEMELKIKTIKGETKTISMKAEINSFWLLDGLDKIIGYEYSASLPVEYGNEGEYGTIRINDFDNDPQLTRSMFLDALDNIKEKELDYLLLDFRQANGAKFLELAGYFMDQDLTIGSLNCLDAYSQPVVVHPAEKKFDFSAVAVITGEACSGSCELEVLAMQQMDNVSVYGMNNTAGSLNAGAKAIIQLPEQNHISFPVCQFSSELLDGNPTIEPDVKLANSYFASIADNDLYLREAFSDLLIRNKVVGEPEEKLQSRTFAEIYDLIYSAYSPDFVIDYNILEMMNYHDVAHNDLYEILHEDDDLRIIFFYLCSIDYQMKIENNKNSTVSVSLDDQQLTDFVMSMDNFENDDMFGRFKDRPCMGWLVSYKKLIPGHHEMQVTVDVQEPVYYEDTYFEKGIHEFDLHFLVLEKEDEVKEPADE